MPRTHKSTKTNVTLYLPPPGVPSTPTSPSLEVLLVAQQIAHTRGQRFDIDSFLAPEQRDEYLALLRDGDDKDDGEGEGGGDEDEGEEVREGEEESNGEKREAEPDSEGKVAEGSRPAKRAKLAQHASPLAQVYWRQRLHRLGNRSGSRSATPRVKNEPDEVASPAPTPTPTGPSRKQVAPLTQKERADIQSSASYWNHLLIQARASRGPQFDYNTQQLQVDRGSEQYYNHGQPPAATPPASPNNEEIPNGTNGQPLPQGTPLGARPSSSSSRMAQSPMPVMTTPLSNPQSLPSASPQHLQRPPSMAQAHAQAQAQAQVRAQALALGQAAEQGLLNPVMMQGQPQVPGINPMQLMGGMPMQAGQFGGAGPMLAGGWEQGFQS